MLSWSGSVDRQWWSEPAASACRERGTCGFESRCAVRTPNCGRHEPRIRCRSHRMRSRRSGCVARQGGQVGLSRSGSVEFYRECQCANLQVASALRTAHLLPWWRFRRGPHGRRCDHRCLLRHRSCMMAATIMRNGGRRIAIRVSRRALEIAV